ncbi:MAG: type II toxin-antitoxin system HicA family toxin [Acidobacteriia bacterium]|nr:type II toxin-antitoxin system HicA family toxin [Terriglobia bacterium]
MPAIPTQLPWRRFVCLLRDLGYRPLKSRRGSMRQFFCPTRSPNLVSFHEPHSGDTLHKGTLNDCLRKLRLNPDEFAQLLGRS